MPQLLVRRIRGEAPPFRFRTEGATYPLYATTTGKIASGSSATLPTGYVFFPPPGMIIQIFGVPDLILGKRVCIKPLCLDHRYREELSVLLWNHGDSPFDVVPGTHVADMVLTRTLRTWIETVDAVSGSTPSAGGQETGVSGTLQALAEGFAVIGRALEGHF